MTEFYTNVMRYGNSILYIGYKNGKRIKERIKFEPTLFVPVQEDSKHKTLEGMNVAPVQPGSMSDCKHFIENHTADNFEIYGNTNYVAQFINQKFPDGCTFDRDEVNVSSIDIEVESDQGFPEPAEAKWPVTAITIKNNQDGIHIYRSWGLGEYDPEQSELEGIERIDYKKCKDEKELLQSFLAFWEANWPDIITGWNSEFFDLPYLINRVARLFGEDETKRFSPHRLVPRMKEEKYTGNISFEIAGISQLDYLRLFKKFAFISEAVDSYKLDNIAFIILGEKKLDYSDYASLSELYKKDHQKFIDYNIKDTQLVDRIEDKMGLITLAMTLAHKANVNYEVAFGSTQIWDTYIFNLLVKDKVVVAPQKPTYNDRKIEGAFVKTPQKGMHHWVMSFDLNSLYPHLIMQYNMSPETIVDHVIPTNVDDMLKRVPLDIPEGCCVSATGQCFSNAKQGMFPKIVEELYEGRSKTKKRMLQATQEREEIPKSDKHARFALDKEIQRADNEQHAIKILMNSLYGAMANKYFRYYDQRIAEAITISGQLSIRWAETTVNDYIQDLMNSTKEDYVLMIDTDSLYVNMAPLVDAILPDADNNKICAFLDKVGSEKFEPLLNKAYGELKEYTNSFEQRMFMAREIIASKVIITGKKRYMANVLNSEGVQYAQPKLKITGIESVRSSTPQVCRKLIEKTIKLIINEDEATVQKFIADARDAFRKLPPEDASFPRGISDIDKYFEDGTYTKGTPIHVRGAIMYNQVLLNNKLEKYRPIQSGDKIKFVYLTMPNPIKENVFGFPDIIPPELDLKRYVDYDMQFDKSYLEPMKSILDAIGWHTEKQSTLESFFE